MKTVKTIPEGFYTITPYLAVQHVKQTIEFLKQAFEAKVVQVHSAPDGRIMNAEVKVGSSMVMLGEKPEGQEGWPAMLYMYVEDADAVFKKAVQAGGKTVMEPVDHFYGDRSGAVEDPSGNQWWIATRKEDVSQEELIRRASQMKK
jgi:uncharacterized glyoxalase superfamily protein PhnB